MRQPIKFLIVLVSGLGLPKWGRFVAMQATPLPLDFGCKDERGVLILSQFTGAARELTEALVVNPYDLDQAAAALAAALRMPADEQRARLLSMRAFLAAFNVNRWAGRMLRDAARLRRHDRLSGRLNDHYLARFMGAELR